MREYGLKWNMKNFDKLAELYKNRWKIFKDIIYKDDISDLGRMYRRAEKTHSILASRF